MALGVFLQRVAVAGPEVAVCAAEIFLLRVHALVPLQVSQRIARKRAELTFVWFLSSVCAHVSLQIHQLRRGVHTVRTLVWFLTIVRLHVPLQVIGVARAETAQLAGERFRCVSVRPALVYVL